MNRLWVRLTLFAALATALSVALVVGLQMLNTSRQYRQLDPAFRAERERLDSDPTLTEAAREERLRSLVVSSLSTEEGF